MVVVITHRVPAKFILGRGSQLLHQHFSCCLQSSVISSNGECIRGGVVTNDIRGETLC